MSLASWWHRVSVRWLTRWLDACRRDPDVTYEDFRDLEKRLSNYKAEAQLQEKNSPQKGGAA